MVQDWFFARFERGTPMRFAAGLRTWLVLGLMAALTGCQSASVVLPALEPSAPVAQAQAVEPAHDERAIIQALEQQHQAWRAVPYQLGGMGRQGVDCSAFVLLTFAQQFGQRLPRTTEQQVRLGEAVDKHRLQPGDLVFFRTSPRVRHVGIYLDEGRFLHASTRVGVTISQLDSPYWQRHYWKAKRVLQ